MPRFPSTLTTTRATLAACIVGLCTLSAPVIADEALSGDVVRSTLASSTFPPALRAELERVVRDVLTPASVGEDKRTHGPAQCARWFQRTWEPVAEYINTPERRAQFSMVVDAQLRLFLLQDDTSDAARAHAAQQAGQVQQWAEEFVHDRFVDTPPDVRTMIIAQAQARLSASLQDWGDYFNPSRAAWPDATTRESLFARASGSHALLDHADSAFAQTRQLIAQPQMTPSSKKAFLEQYAERQGRLVAMAFLRSIDEDAIRQVREKHPESASWVSPEAQEAMQHLMGDISKDVQRDGAAQHPSQRPTLGKTIASRIGTTTTAGVPRGAPAKSQDNNTPSKEQQPSPK